MPRFINRRKQVRVNKHSDLLFSLERATGVEPASSAWKSQTNKDMQVKEGTN